MKTITFSYPHFTGGYGCSAPGNNSGEYVPAATVRRMLRRICDRIGQQSGQVEALEETRQQWESSAAVYSNLLGQIEREAARRAGMRAILEIAAADLGVSLAELAEIASEAGAVTLAAELRAEAEKEQQ